MAEILRAPLKSDAVRMARSGSWIDAGGKLLPPLLICSWQFENRPVAINVLVGWLHYHTQRHLNKHRNHSFHPLRLLSNFHTSASLPPRSPQRQRQRASPTRSTSPSSASSPVHTAKHPRRRSARSSAAWTKNSSCNSTVLRTALHCKIHWRTSRARGVCRIFS